MNKAIVLVLALIGVLALSFGVGLLLAWPLMLILNYLFTPSVLFAIFGIGQLTFWKTYWLSVAAGLLFGSHSTSTK